MNKTELLEHVQSEMEMKWRNAKLEVWLDIDEGTITYSVTKDTRYYGNTLLQNGPDYKKALKVFNDYVKAEINKEVKVLKNKLERGE